MQQPENHQVIKRKRRGLNGVSHALLRIDMTPMVDLGFLLITFFVITAELAKPTMTDLAMPTEGPPMALAESKAITVITDGNKHFYYEGAWDLAVTTNQIRSFNLAGANSLRNIILDKQQRLSKDLSDREGKSGLMLLIKPGKNTSYKTLLDILDETAINEVKKYAIIPQSEPEKRWMEQ